MKLWARLCVSALLSGICCTILCSQTSLAGDEVTIKPVSNVTLPLERYEDGKIKTKLIAGTAKPPIQGDWEAWDVRIEFYTPEGVVEAFMTADDCRYNREAGIAKSESKVRVERSDIIITGKGFEWSAKDQVVKILSDVKVTLIGDLKLPTTRGANQ
jgi:hypothetical protein